MMELTGLPAISLPLPWHKALLARLVGQCAEGKLPHALLLSGSNHTGISQLALALTRQLLCAEPQAGLNCGQCHACQLSATGVHGDFKWLQPEEKSRSIKIDQVRDAVQFTTRTAAFGARKVVVLAPADTMNVNAFNALLKSLEEPAPETYLLLVCHRLHNVPATIRSRCQLLRVPNPADEACLPWLDQITSERAVSEQLLALAPGLPLLAQQLFETDTATEMAGRRHGFYALLRGQISVPDLAAAWSELDVDELLSQLTQEIQQLLLSLSAHQLQTSAGRAAFEMLDEISRIRRSVSAGANPNKQLLVEALLAKMHRRLGVSLLGDNIPTQRGDARI